ncbi:MAG: hypothetical protein J1F29_05905 [Lentimicrobiaceae bacterium]|nr:hypothetical protein [Lentimicrobiaceae bacterium]
MRKKRIFFWSAVAIAALLAMGTLCSCSNSRNLCPAYNSHYKVEPLPY